MPQRERARATRLDLLAAVKEAAIAALVAFGLFVLMIGIRTDQGPTGALVLTTRFGALAAIVAAVFVGRLVCALRLARSDAFDRSLCAAPPVKTAASGASALSSRIALSRSFALVVPIIFYGNRYLLDLAILILTYTMLGFGLNIVVGLAGLLDLGYVAFYAVGAYSYALLAQTFGLSFWICLPLAGILAAFAGVLLGFPVLRLRGDYLAIVTLGFGEIIRLILLNWQSLTGGPNGISGIPRPSFFGLPFNTVRRRLCRDVRPALLADPPHRVSLLPHSCARAPDQLGDAAAAPAADRPRLGSVARGRDRLPRARHQHHHDQAHRVCHGRDVRRLCRRLLRHAAGLHQSGILHLRENRLWCWRSSCSAAWARSSASRSPRPSCSAASNCSASSINTACWCSAPPWSRS